MNYATTENPADWKLPSPRKLGILTLILAESALFTIFVVAYLFYMGKSLNGPYPHEVLEFPLLGTIAARSGITSSLKKISPSPQIPLAPHFTPSLVSMPFM